MDPHTNGTRTIRGLLRRSLFTEAEIAALDDYELLRRIRQGYGGLTEAWMRSEAKKRNLL